MWLLWNFSVILAFSRILICCEDGYGTTSSLLVSEVQSCESLVQSPQFLNDGFDTLISKPALPSTSQHETLSSASRSSSKSVSSNNDKTSMLMQQQAVKSFPSNAADLKQGTDNSNQTFLSFNEWRLAKMNQEVIQEQQRSKAQEQIDTLEAEPLGDDMEIELSVFSTTDTIEEKQESEPEGKVYNHKFNFASLDCAATIVKTNSEASGATSILTENKDKYLLNPCSAANKFIIIELCQDILVEEVALANFEFFSSTFSRIRLSVSDLYPVAKNGWRVLGEFDAEDSRNLQIFPIQNPQIWARYLRVEILSHHDNEFYCPLSLVRVHGKTMMDEFKMENTQEFPSSQENSQEVEELEDETSEQCINEIIEKCNSWPSINPDNITYLPNLPDTFSNCQSKLVPLKFEEFLKELNRSHCLPKTKNNSSTFPPPPSFSTEESIFKNIMKRLTTLESNANLTVLYIEEQSKLLAESFEQMEKTQFFNFDNLVSIFNQTIMENLNVLRVFANQLKDQSIRILEEQKLNNDQFTTQNTIKLTNLEKELRTQQRFAYAITTGLIAVIVYYILHRNSFLEGPENSTNTDTKVLKRKKKKI
ncbi:hypothetical protein ZYGR_0K00280 [Zygosaccharomyces rouxii]|uniref:SUN-like protein 1 n=1 Tax=Zygosaccharomyces rouxii TaxID=4956 RepID=A0A1Q2ZYZ7_ZYGRO|nr:hypothetical protein ZYGR_0K00280 [Zygosaccharomyces rouxii]